MAISDGDNVVEASNYQNLALTKRTVAMTVLGAVAGNVIRANGDLVAYGATIAGNDNLRIVLSPQPGTAALSLRRVRIVADANTGQRGEGVVIGTFALELPTDANTIVEMVTFLTDENMIVSAAAADVEEVGGSN